MSHSVTQILEDEHLVIVKVVSAASLLADRLETGQTIDVQMLQGTVEFMRIFADKCHHGKEEDLLFPLLGEKGIPLQGCPIGALIMEHGMGRKLVKELADGAENYRKDELEGKQAVITALRGIADLYPSHIWKEDYLLFPLANKVLIPEEQQALCQQFQQVEETIGQDNHRRLQSFAECLEQQIQRVS